MASIRLLGHSIRFSLLHLFLVVVAANSRSSKQPGSDDRDTLCQPVSDMPSECSGIFRGSIYVAAKERNDSSPSSAVSTTTTITTTTTTLPLIDDKILSQLNDSGSCRTILNAWLCYYIYTPCHVARGTQLPVCTQQCWEMYEMMNNCYTTLFMKEDDEEDVSSNKSSLLAELVDFVSELNCSLPDSFQVSLLPVDEEKCSTLYVSSASQGSNRLPEIIVLCLLIGVGISLTILLLVIGFTMIVCLRRKKKLRQSKVACSQQQASNGSTTLRRLDSPNPTATIERYPSTEEINVRSDVQVARMITDRKRRQYVSLYTGSFIPYKHLQLGPVIGEGAYGKVVEGVWKDPSIKFERRVAVKTLRSFSSEQQLNTLFTESRAMRDLDHPNVMKFLGMCFDSPEGYPYIILPYMSHGSLLDYLKKKSSSTMNTIGEYPQGLEVDVLFQFCLDIVDGMAYLVEQKFVHRDLAARNCMVSDTKTILIGDFGLAEDLYSRGQKQSGVRQPVKWMPPESLRDGVSNETTDMWSYGVTCWEVFSLGRSPYPGIENHEILHHISSGGRLKKPNLCPEPLYDIVRGCWQYNPKDRPSFAEMALTLRQCCERYFTTH